MAVRKIKGGSALPTPNERALADAIARARPRPDAIDTSYYTLAHALAERLGLKTADIIEEMDERAGCLQFVEMLPRAEAERRAWLDCCERFDRQKAIAI